MSNAYRDARHNSQKLTPQTVEQILDHLRTSKNNIEYLREQILAYQAGRNSWATVQDFNRGRLDCIALADLEWAVRLIAENTDGEIE